MYIPLQTLKRMPMYLDLLQELKEKGDVYVKSTYIAKIADIAASTVRYDMSFISQNGVRGLGYTIIDVIDEIREIIGYELEKNTAVIGVGNMGKAFMKYNKRNIKATVIVAGFDVESKSGGDVDGIRIYKNDDMQKIVKELDIEIAILTLPAERAQEAFDLAVKAGITGFVNFSSKKIINEHMNVHIRDFDIEYAMHELISKSKKKK